jgi:hypothetical protein
MGIVVSTGAMRSVKLSLGSTKVIAWSTNRRGPRTFVSMFCRLTLPHPEALFGAWRQPGEPGV